MKMAELRQSSFNETPKKTEFSAPNQKHLACVLVLDTSLSMAGEGIDSLNEGVRRFINQTSMDKTARECVDVAIIEFNDHAHVIREFTPLSKTEPVNMVAQGCTAMGEAINLAIDKAKERNMFYSEYGTPIFQPWIVLITDGIPTDDISSAAARIKEEEAKDTYGKIKFWSVGVPGYDLKTLARLSTEKRIIELSNKYFTGFFDWLSESMVTISVSKPGIRSPLPDLPNNARPIRKNEIPDEWNDDCNW